MTADTPGDGAVTAHVEGTQDLICFSKSSSSQGESEAVGWGWGAGNQKNDCKKREGVRKKTE